MNGYRTYDEDDLRLLQQIRTLQDFGFELEKTRPFVECLRAGHPAGDSCADSIDVYRRKLAELDGLIGRLGSVRGQFAAELARAEAARAPEPACDLTYALARGIAGTAADEMRESSDGGEKK